MATAPETKKAPVIPDDEAAKKARSKSARVVQESRYGGPHIILKERYRLFPEHPLPELDSPTAKAFVAEDKRDVDRDLYVILVPPEVPSRMGTTSKLRGLQGTAIMPMIEYALVHWPTQTSLNRYFAVIFERPMGGPLMPDLSGKIQRMHEMDFNLKVVRPLVMGLMALMDHGVVHRNIRPTNIFWRDAKKEEAVFGECISAPPGYNQPALYETIELGACHPAGRGEGSETHDLYALGATLHTLLRGSMPHKKLSDADIVSHKLKRGSYQFFTTDDRVPLSLLDLFRGLLADDEEQRWTTEALEMWLAGRRTSPVQGKSGKRTDRAMKLGGVDHNTPVHLAYTMNEYWEDAKLLLNDGDLANWLSRGLEDKETGDLLEDIARNARIRFDDPDQQSDLMLTQTLVALDPAGPLRYKKLTFMPEGIGPLLHDLRRTNDPRLKTLGEAVLRNMTDAWQEMQMLKGMGFAPPPMEWEEMRVHLQRPGLGNGFERCIYLLAETLPCQSPMVRSSFVIDSKELLPALELCANTVDQKQWPVDGDVAAFIASRFRFDTTKHLMALNNAEPSRAAVGLAALLAFIQWRQGPESLLNLTLWVGNHVAPAVNSYHSRELRKKLMKDVPRIARNGSLPELHNAIDNVDLRRQDMLDFSDAQKDYKAAHEEIIRLESMTDKRKEEAQLSGRQVASMISMGVSVIGGLAVILSRVF